MNKTAVIVAGGKGERMQSIVPKQFIEIAGKPILMHTLEVFQKFDASISIVLVLPAVQVEYWQTLCKKYTFDIKHQIVIGGNTRFQSVKNGLSVIEHGGLVAIHDGVRPLVSADTILRCFDAAKEFGNAIPCSDLIESIRFVDFNHNKSVDRTAYKSIQTPQVFQSELVKSAYNQPFSDEFTDDASVLESTGAKIHLVNGNRENIKITTDFDLIIAELFLNKKFNDAQFK